MQLVKFIPPKKKVLLLSGGGLKGIYMLGSLHYYFEYNMLNNIELYIGVSIGSIINFLIIIGYCPLEIYEFFYNFNLTKLKIDKDIDFENLILNYGLTDCKKILLILKKFMYYKNIPQDITLLELYEKTNKHFIIITACIDSTITRVYDDILKEEVLDYKTNPNLRVLEAINMSINIPVFFEPITKNQKFYIDGGVVNNFPIEYVFSNNYNINEIIAIYLCDTVIKINNLFNYLHNILYGLIYKNTWLKVKKYEKFILIIENNFDIKLINLGLNKKDIKKMFHYGYCKARNNK